MEVGQSLFLLVWCGGGLLVGGGGVCSHLCHCHAMSSCCCVVIVPVLSRCVFLMDATSLTLT